MSELQQEIETILGKGGFQIKSWECSGKPSSSKYLGMTWDRLQDRYILKFRLNLHKKLRGIPLETDLDSEFLQDASIPITKKNVLSVACQFYDPTGLAAPLMFSVRSLFSELCRDPTCSFNSILSEERTNRFRRTVNEILFTRDISFPHQIIFNYSAQLFIFFDGSIQGYGACVYICSENQFNLLSSSAKIMGKVAFSAPQSEIAGAVLASRMVQKISQELSNVNLLPSLFIGDSEIILNMIAKNDPASPPVFYGTRLMEILSVTIPENWFWCPGNLNPADLLTRSGTKCDQINSKFWLQGGFLAQEKSTWPTKPCHFSTYWQHIHQTNQNQHHQVGQPLPRTFNQLIDSHQSLSRVIKALVAIHKACRTWREDPTPTQTWISVKNSITASVLRCFVEDSEIIIATNELKHLVVQPMDGIYYVSDRSFRFRIGVPLINKKTILAECIVKDAHTEFIRGLV